MEKIKGIYKNILLGTNEIQKQRGIVDKQIENFLMEEREEMEGRVFETLRDKFYQIAMLAEENGFILGFQYAVQLMAECSEK